MDIMTRLEDVLRAGTGNEVVDARLLKFYEQIRTLHENCPEWNLLSKDRQAFLILVAMTGVECWDNEGLH